MLICTLSLGLVTAAALTINDWSGGVQYFVRMFAIFEHFGPFCLSLVSLLIVLRLLGRQSLTLWIILTLIQTFAIASNKSYVIIYVGPSFVALILEWRRRAVSPGLVLHWALCVTISGAAAMLLLAELELQPVPGSPKVLVHVMRYVSGLTGLLVENPVSYVLLVLAPLVLMLLYRWMQPALFQTQPARFVWTVACMATIAADLFCAAYYEDHGSLRYITASLFWPLIFVAASLAIWASTSRSRSLATLAVTIVGFCTLAASAISSARSFHGWHQPLADCLVQNRQTWGLKDGLADHWLARPLVISSGWSPQIGRSLRMDTTAGAAIRTGRATRPSTTPGARNSTTSSPATSTPQSCHGASAGRRGSNSVTAIRSGSTAAATSRCPRSGAAPRLRGHRTWSLILAVRRLLNCERSGDRTSFEGRSESPDC